MGVGRYVLAALATLPLIAGCEARHIDRLPEPGKIGKAFGRTCHNYFAADCTNYIDFIDMRAADERPANYGGILVFVDYTRNGYGIDYYTETIQRPDGQLIPFHLQDIKDAPAEVKAIAARASSDYERQEASKPKIDRWFHVEK